MHIEVSHSTLGATVTEVDLTAEFDVADAEEIRSALDDRGVLAFPGQHLDDEGLKRVASLWAPPQPHPVAEFVGGSEVIGVVFNDADHPPAEGGDSTWHTDYSFNPEIPDVAVLRSVTAPSSGGNTVWADARAAAASLEPATRERVETMVGHHDPGPRFVHEMTVRMGEEIGARVGARFGFGYRHPVISAHPRTGDPLLFVNPGYTRYLIGVAEDDPLLGELFAAFGDPNFQFEHAWTEGDVVIWDEHRTVHRGPNDFGTQRRELHRCTAGHQAPVAAIR